MKKLVLAAAVAVVSACGVPPASEAPPATASRSDALETTLGDAKQPTHLEFTEPMDIVVTDPRIVERAGQPLLQHTFFYDAFGGGSHGCGCGCR